MTTETLPSLTFESLTVHFQREEKTIPAANDISFNVAPSTFTSVVGPSGCGKSTLLRVASGIIPPTSGQVRIGGEPVSGMNRDVGFVTQDSNLFPWLTLEQNLLFPLQLRRIEKSRAREMVRDQIAMVGLQGFENHYPYELSGGMQKRAAIGRTLIYSPKVILMDEPFGSVDALTRLRLHSELLKIWEQHRKTILFITHDLSEAIALSDQIVIMTRHPGTIKAVFDVPIPRPRDPYTVTTLPEFGEVYDQIWQAFRTEVVTDGDTAPRQSGDPS